MVSIALAAGLVLGQFRPHDELARMLVTMARLKTFEATTGLSWTRPDTGGRSTTTLFTQSQVNLAEPSAIEHDTTFRVVRVSRSEEEADLSGEVRLLDGTAYVTYAPPGPDIEGVTFEDEAWIAMNEGEARIWGSIIPGLYPPIFYGQTDTSPWQPETLTNLRVLLAQADVFSVKDVKVTEVVDGQTTRLFDATFDREAIRAFLHEVIRLREGREPTDDERLEVEAQASALESLSLRLWIGSGDHLLYRVQATGAFVEEDRHERTSVDLVVNLSRFNEPFDAKKPQKTVLFAAIYQEAFGSLPEAEAGSAFVGGANPFGQADAHLPVLAAEEVTDADQDGLSDIVEAFFGTDRNNPDTDGDGASDGEEVLTGQNPRGDGSLFGFGL